MNIIKLRTTYLLIVLILIVFSFSTKSASATIRTSESLGASGWSLPTSEYVGIDTTTCGASSTVGQIQLVDEYSSVPVSVLEAPMFQIQIQDKNGNTIEEFWTINSNISRKFCYQLSSDYVRVHTVSNPYFYDHVGVHLSMKPEDPTSYHGKSYLGRVHLKSLSDPKQNIASISPFDTYLTSEQSYLMDIRNLPNIYNSTELLLTIHNVVNTISMFNTQTVLNSSGSSGIQTMPPLGLADGFYQWSYFVALNGDVTQSNGMQLNNGVPVSASTQPVFFTIDSTAPSNAVDITLVSTTSTQVNVTITNDVQDSISGTNYTTFYLRETSPGNSSSSIQVPLSYRSISPQRASVSLTLTPGSTYEFYATTADVLGNVSTSSVQTYTAPTGTLGPIVARISSPVTTSTTGNYVIEYGLSNNISFNAEASTQSGGFLAANAWEWRLDNCWLGEVYSTQKSFSTSTVNNRLLGDGTPRTVYLRAQANLSGTPWSNNCPSVKISINCPSGGVWDGYSCTPGVVTYPDLVSQNLAVSAGPYQMNDTIAFSAETKNMGAANTIFISKSKFFYSWDNGNTWNDSLGAYSHGSISTGEKVSDSYIFTAQQVGSLLVRHCVDTNNSINEGPLGESPNCTTVGPLTVTNEPSATLSGNGCTIPNSGTASSCNGRLTWNFTFVNSANIFNLTNQTFYSHSLTGSNFSVPLQYGPNVIQARNFVFNTPNVLNQITLTASCDTNVSFWDGAKCGPLPIIDISAIPATVRAGQSTAIKIGITSDYTFNCQLLGADTMTSDLTHTGGPTIQYYEFPTRKLYSAQIIKITCDVMGNNIEIDTRIDIVGSPFEV